MIGGAELNYIKPSETHQCTALVIVEVGAFAHRSKDMGATDRPPGLQTLQLPYFAPLVQL